MKNRSWLDRQSTETEDWTGTSKQIAEGFRMGDPDAVEAVRARIQSLVSFRGLGLPEPDRKDIEQEVFTHVWRSVTRSSFDTSLGFWGFISTVALRRCIDWRRSQKDVVEIDVRSPDQRPSPLQTAIAREKTDRALAAIAELDASCRELLQRRIAHRQSWSEISQDLGRSSGALRVQFHRCVKKAQAAVRRQDEV